MTEIEAEIREIYLKTDDLYRKHTQIESENALGYAILYGPPIRNAPILFIGFQPGGNKFEKLPDTKSDTPWPEQCEYVNETYRLAKQLKTAFGAEFLSGCTGLNAIFLRAPQVDSYNANWSREVREEFQKFSLQNAKRIAELIAPKLIVALGFSTLQLLGQTSDVVFISKTRRNLIKSGSIMGINSLAIRHPTGSRPPPNDQEMQDIGRFILKANEHYVDDCT